MSRKMDGIYKCICGFSSTNKKWAKRHLKKCPANNNYFGEMEKYTFQCLYCSKRFKTHKALIGHRGLCPKQKEKYNSLLTREFLEENLIKNGFSAHYIARILLNGMCSTGMIIQYAKQYGIKTKNIKEANALPHRWITTKQTNLKKYGIENTFQLPTTQQTLQRKYGKNITNIFQVESIKEKSKKTMVEKYGVSHTVYMKDYKKNHGTLSRAHKKLSNYLSSISIKHINENPGQMFFKFNKELNKNYCPRPDIILPDQKIIIEINGDYYHANPKKYKKTDIIHKWVGDIEAEKIWQFDKIRKKHLESFGYEVIIFWNNNLYTKTGFKKTKEFLWKKLKSNQ